MGYGGCFEVLPRGERSSNFLAIKDRFVCYPRFIGAVTLVGVFDGHGKNGHHVAEFVAGKLGGLGIFSSL